MAIASVFDVAEYLLDHTGSLSAMKLQKLIYYCQAWSLVWDERPLFNEEIQAWKNGPVVRALYDKHSGRFLVEPGMFDGNPDHLDQDARDTIQAVIEYYGSHTAQWLSDLTHSEDPWREARRGLGPEETSQELISLASMHKYYSGLVSNE